MQSIALTRLFVLVIATSLIVSCSKAPSDLDESALLQQFGFNNPISLTVRLDSIDGQQAAAANDQNLDLVALLTRRDYLSIEPNLDTQPWWRFKINSGTLDKQANPPLVTVNLGSRSISRRSEEQLWTEGSIQLYAETITYSLDLTGEIKKDAKPSLNNLTLRLVAMKDPAVGKWQLLTDPARGTKLGQDEAAVFISEMTASGHADRSDLATKINNATLHAFEQIQHTLDANEILAISNSSPDVLISKKNGLAYYKKLNEVNGLVLSQAANYCNALVVPSFGHWRLPTMTELMALLSDGRFIDVPDRRLWGDFTKREKGPIGNELGISVPSGTVKGMIQDAPNHYLNVQYDAPELADLGRLPALGFPKWSVLSLSGGFAVESDLTISFRDVRPSDFASSYLFRIMCVSSYPPPPPLLMRPADVDQNAVLSNSPPASPAAQIQQEEAVHEEQQPAVAGAATNSGSAVNGAPGGAPLAPASQSPSASVAQAVNAAYANDENALSAAMRLLDGLMKPAHGDRKAARASNTEGLSLLDKGDVQGAAGAFARATQQDPSDPEVWSNLADTDLKANRVNEAGTAAIGSLALAPERASAWGTYGVVLARQGKQVDAAGSFLVAYRYSRNQQKTKDYLQSLFSQDADQRVRRAAGDALERIKARGASAASNGTGQLGVAPHTTRK